MTELEDLIKELIQPKRLNQMEVASNPATNAALLGALFKLGCERPNPLISAVHLILVRDKEFSSDDQIFILKAVTSVLERREILERCDNDKMMLLINLVTQKISLTKESEDSLAIAACALLVAISKSQKFIKPVMDTYLLGKFPPGVQTPPHRHIILTMAAIAETNPSGFLPYLTDILSRIVYVLPHIKGEPIRTAFCSALCAFCNCVSEVPSTSEQNEADENSENDAVKYADYADLFEKAFNQALVWLEKKKDTKTRANALKCIGTLCSLIPRDRFIRDLKIYVDYFITDYRNSKNTLEEQLIISKGISKFLEVAYSDETIPIENYIDDLLDLLFPSVSSICSMATDEGPSSPTAINHVHPSDLQLKLKNEALNCYCIASVEFPKTFYSLLTKMHNTMDETKLGAIEILRHLLNCTMERSSNETPGLGLILKESDRQLITLGLKQILGDEKLSLSTRVKTGLISLCLSLADNDFMKEDDGKSIMAFLLLNLKPTTDAASSKKAQKLVTPAATADMTPLQHQCSQALFSICRNCTPAHRLLWPTLFEYICAPEYTTVIADLVKCLLTLTQNARKADNLLDFTTGFDTNQRLAGRFAVFSRLLVQIGRYQGSAPSSSTQTNDAVELFVEFLEWFHPIFSLKLSDRSKTEARKLLATLEKLNKSTYESTTWNQYKSERLLSGNCFLSESNAVKSQRWKTAVLEFLSSLLRFFCEAEEEKENVEKWLEDLAEAQTKQLSLFNDSSDEKAFLMCCLGQTLSRIEKNREFVLNHINHLFRDVTNHSSPVERSGFAQAIGISASKFHIEPILVELENYTKEKRKSASRAGAMMSTILTYTSRSNVEAENAVNMKATIILSFGYIIYHSAADKLPHLDNTVLTFLRQYIGNSKEVLIREAHLEAINLFAQYILKIQLPKDYQFQARVESFSYIKQYLSADTDMLNNLIPPYAARAIASLVQLSPLSDNELEEQVTLLARHILPLCREQSGLKMFGIFRSQIGHTSAELLYPNIELIKDVQMQMNSIAGLKMDDLGRSESTVMEATMVQFRQAIAHIVMQKPKVEPTVRTILKIFKQFYGSPHDHERSRAIELTLVALNVYLNNATDVTLGHAREFDLLPGILGRLSPRLCDSLYLVRVLSLHTIWLAFKLQSLHSGVSLQADEDFLECGFDGTNFLRLYLGNEGKLDSNSCGKAIEAISRTIDEKLPKSNEPMELHFSVLFEIISDSKEQGSVSGAAAKLLGQVLTNRAQILSSESTFTTKIFGFILEKLNAINSERSKDLAYGELLNTFVVFSSYHCQMAVDRLLRQPMPYSKAILDVFRCISSDRRNFPTFLQYTMHLLQSEIRIFSNAQKITTSDDMALSRSPSPNAVPFDSNQQAVLEKRSESSLSSFMTEKQPSRIHTEMEEGVKIISKESCALLSAILELIKGGQPLSELSNRFPALMANLFEVLIAVIDAHFSGRAQQPLATQPTPKKGKKDASSPPPLPTAPPATSSAAIAARLAQKYERPVKMVIEPIQQLLSRISAENVNDKMNIDRVWTNATMNNQSVPAITSLCQALCEHRPEYAANLLHCMADQYTHENISEEKRIAAIAVLSALVIRCPDTNGKFDSVAFAVVFESLEKAALSDSNTFIVKLAINGLGQIGAVMSGSGKEKFVDAQYLERGVTATINVLEKYSNASLEDLTVEAFLALDRLVIPLPSASDILVENTSKIIKMLRDSLTSANASRRIAAFSLYKNLGEKVLGGQSPQFLGSLNDNCNILLLHLFDVEPSIKANCAELLKIVIDKVLDFEPDAAKKLNELLLGVQTALAYDEFLRHFCSILAHTTSFKQVNIDEHLLDCASHLNSQLARIRRNSIALLGYLMSALSPEMRTNVSKALIFPGFINLLDDADADVRLATINAISLLFSY